MAQGGNVISEVVQPPKIAQEQTNRRLKAEHEQLQQKVLDLELQIERNALDNKIAVQKKDDEIYESKLLLKHKENELRTMQSNFDRAREDFTFRLQESLDKLHDRLAMEKHQDIQGINQRNEVLIKQLVDFHS